MSLDKVFFDKDGTPLDLIQIEQKDLKELFDRLDSLDYKLWEILKIAKAFAEKEDLVVQED